MLRQLVSRVQKSLRRRGWLGTLGFAVVAPVRLVRTKIRRWRRGDTIDRDFDHQYNVDTGGYIHLAQFNIQGPTADYAVAYEGIAPDVFHAMMAAARFDPQGRTFIDFGCGKGRGLLLASDYPFHHVIGVELARELVEVARRNLTTYTNPARRCTSLEVVCEDATTYPIPEVPLVVFMNNPFDAPLMELVVGNLTRSIEKCPRAVVVLYANPVHAALWDRVPYLAKTDHTDDYAIYKLGPVGSAHPTP